MMLLGQLSQQIWRGWMYVTHTRSLAMVLGIGFAVLAVVLLIASRTRWGQTKPLTKCVVLSVLAHVWLLMYVLGSQAVLPQGSPNGRSGQVAVAFESEAFEPAFPTPPALLPETNSSVATLEPESDTTQAFEPQPWERTVPLAELPQPSAIGDTLAKLALAAPALLTPLEPTPLPPLPADDSEAIDDSSPLEDLAQSAPVPAAESGLPSAESANMPDNSVLPPTSMLDSHVQQVGSESASSASVISLPSMQEILPPAAADSSQMPPQPIQPQTVQPQPVQPRPVVPPEYQLRQASNRLQLAVPFGADADSEAAVQAGLAWLVGAQSPDGSWNSLQHGGGTETYALGETRYGTGDKADTGISGLALLAFLSAGHTHLHGDHRSTVQRGLQYLLRAQMPSGDLSGPKQIGSDRGVLNARMYCHSIATLALAEAHAMTGDVVLKDALVRAAQYSINAQDPRGGGWRYRPMDAGDLSQFGWQAMALKSVERSGIDIPTEVHARMRRFSDSCAAGVAGGLATYQPKNGRPSETMTAEGLACRLLLGYPVTLAARQEALGMIMNSRPGMGEDNVYYWYYATLALFQLQDENWRIWNQALKQRLLATQVPPYGEQPGSWTPDRMWGGYGGRVYSTAMSCLCLEVYYRYLPMYQLNVAQLPTHHR